MPFSQLPEKNAYIAGLMLWNDDQVPVFNLHKKFNTAPVTDCKMIVIAVSNEKLLAFAIDGVECILDVSCACIYPFPSITETGRWQSINKIADVGTRMIPLLNPEQLFGEISFA